MNIPAVTAVKTIQEAKDSNEYLQHLLFGNERSSGRHIDWQILIKITIIVIFYKVLQRTSQTAKHRQTKGVVRGKSNMDVK